MGASDSSNDDKVGFAIVTVRIERRRARIAVEIGAIFVAFSSWLVEGMRKGNWNNG